MRLASRIVETVLREFSSRKGFDWWWEDIDEDVQQEIREALTALIEADLDA